MSRKIFRKIVLTIFAALTLALPALALEPRDALSARPESSVYLTLRLSDTEGLLKSTLSLIDAEALARLADMEGDVDSLRIAMALIAQIPAKTAAVAVGISAEGPFLQAAVSLNEEALKQLPLIAEGKASPESVTMALLGQSGLVFAGMLKPTLQMDENGPFYTLLGDSLVMTARENLVLIGATPGDLNTSLDALGDKEARLEDKRRFLGESGGDYVFFHADMALMAALTGDAAKKEGMDMEALQSRFKAPLEFEIAFDSKPGSFLTSFGMNLTEAVPSLAYLKDLKTARGANFFQAGGGTLFLALAGQTAFDPSKLEAQPAAAAAWKQLLAALAPMGVTEADLKDLLTGTVSLAAGNAASAFEQSVPGCYLALEGTNGAAAKILSKILSSEALGSALPLISVKLEGWSSLFALDPQSVPVSGAAGVRGETLFIGLADAPRLNEKPKFSPKAQSLLDENCIAAGFFDADAVWSWMRNALANPIPILEQALAGNSEVKTALDEIMGAELAVNFVQLRVPSAETAFLEFSLPLTDVPQEKALIPRLLNALNEFNEPGGGAETETNTVTAETRTRTANSQSSPNSPNPQNSPNSPNTRKISSVLEFYEALGSGSGSGKTLVFEPGQYNLTNLETIPFKYFGKSQDGSGAELFWDKVFDGYELRIKGMKNLTLRGTPTPEGGTMTDLIVDPRYAFVIHFEDCENIRIESIVAGHSEAGECQGGVYRFTNCTGVTLDRSGMYGSGTEGLRLENVRDFSATASTIFSCTYYIMTVEGGGNIAFENCTFAENREFGLVNVAGTDGLTFDDCGFTDNSGEKMFSVDAASKNVLVKNTKFMGNSMAEPIANARNVVFMNCEFE